MSRRRKSSTPCMVRVVSGAHDQDDQEEAMEVETSPESCGMVEKSRDAGRESSESPMSPVENPNPEPLEQEREVGAKVADDFTQADREKVEPNGRETDPQKTQARGYACKYCTFSTHILNTFKEHVDSSHPNVILNPLYLCTVCNFSTKKFDSLTEHNESQHPGETDFKFKRVKANNQTVLEQTIEGKDNSVECDLTGEQGENGSGVTLFPPCISTTVKAPENIQILRGNDLKSQMDGFLPTDPITAVNINGTVIIPEPTVLHGLSHVTPLLQRPPNFNSVPKIAVPLNTTKYNPSLDSNFTLITSFNKFPYPTHAELSWLTAASKHPEEQIKVWFTTQRLKQGITWSPEEVEEARKKMFNGSIPPAHHTFTVLPTSPVSQPSAKASSLVHANGLTVVTTSTVTSPTRASVASSYALKRHPTTNVTMLFSPELKRPIMAVAPHSGDPKDKGLMAPPPPPPPLKDRLPMAPPPVPMEMKRPSAIPLATSDVKRKAVAVPLMPPPSSLPLSLTSKGKMLTATSLSLSGNPKTKPAVPLSSIVFPQSLTRPYIVNPPIIAPPYKNYLIPHPSSVTSKEKHPITHALLGSDLKLHGSPPLVAAQIRRPTIIQSARIPVKSPSQIPCFASEGQKWKEQQGMELKASFTRGDKVLTPLSEANGVSRDQNSHASNNGVIHLDNGQPLPPQKQEHKQKPWVPTQFPLLERMKGKTPEQLKILEENFLQNSFPTHSDMDNLAAATRLSRQEIESWFLERRALRDNLEQALLNSMGTRKTSAAADKRQQQTVQLNGIHKPRSSGGHLKSPPPPQIMPIVGPTPPAPLTPSVPHPSSYSVPLDSRSLAPLKDDFAQMRWPSPEELIQLETRTGLVRTDLMRWFTDSRLPLKSGSAELTEPFQKTSGTDNGVNSGQGVLVSTPENTHSIIQRCQEGGVKTSSVSNKALEADVSRLAEHYANSLGNQQHQELHDWFNSRLRQQSALEMKNGGGETREVFGGWTEDGAPRRGRDMILLEREQKMPEETSGRLTG